MTFKHLDYIAQFLLVPGLNDAFPYGVSITPATPLPGADTPTVGTQAQPYYRAIGVHHLTGSENNGKNNIFLDVLDEKGQRIGPPWPLVDWEWKDMRGDEKPGLVVLDKPLNEPGGNIGLHAAQIATVWVAGRSSDKVAGLQTAGIDDPNEEPGNHRYHNSFYVVFQRTIAGAPSPKPAEGWRDGFYEPDLRLIDFICDTYHPGSMGITSRMEGIIVKMAELLNVLSK